MAPPLVVRDNAEWLRYVFFCGAAGMVFLLANLLSAAQADAGKLLGAAIGAALFAFCGWVLPVRRVVIDPAARQIVVESRRIGRRTIERLGFADVSRILVVRTFDHDPEALPANRRRERWSVVLLARAGSHIPLSINPEVSKGRALALAARARGLLGVEASDDPLESEAYLASAGRTVDAVAVVRASKGGALGEALDQARRAGGSHRP